MAPSYGSYQSTGVGSQTPPFRVSPDGQTTPRRREKVSRIVPHARRPLSRTFPAPSLSLSRLSWEDAGVAHGAPDGCEERWVWCVVEEAGVHGTELGPRTDQPRRQRRRTQTTRRLRHRPARGDGTPKQWKDGLFSSRRNPNLLYIETMKVCKKWLLYSNGEHSDSLGKTVVKWIML